MEVEELGTQVRWKNHRRPERTRPDKIFALRTRDMDDRWSTQYFALELDLANEVICPSDDLQRTARFWQRSTLLRKYVIYNQAFARKDHVKQLGIPSVRVLTVTTTPERVDEIRRRAYEEEVAKDTFYGKPRPGLFLFGDLQTLGAARNDPLSLAYKNAVGRPTRLV